MFFDRMRVSEGGVKAPLEALRDKPG